MGIVQAQKTATAISPTCYTCGLPGRNPYRAPNGKTYDLCDACLYEFLRRLTNKIREIRAQNRSLLEAELLDRRIVA